MAHVIHVWLFKSNIFYIGGTLKRSFTVLQSNKYRALQQSLTLDKKKTK